MSGEGQKAYSTDEQAVVDAYRQALIDAAAAAERIRDGLAALGAGPRVYVRSSGFSGVSQHITAVEQQGDHVPEGWRVVRGNLEPRRGKPGEAARQWLLDHQPVDIRHVMESHGLPRACWVPREREFGWRIVTPKLFEHDGTLWACYLTEPGTSDSGFDTDRCSWTPRRLSEFFAAFEAHEAAAMPAVATAAPS